MGHAERHDTGSGSASPSTLSERDTQILAFERQWWRHPGAKEEAIRLEFDISAARYYQLLRTVIDSPAALVHDPMLIKRLQRLREARAEVRLTRLHGATDAHHDR